ncbi:ABC transporter ATP-binding protein [Rhizomonospora bruguierae]|uniref:ABC transporter ATP-binding protein n=1 Tax=Rhizomonospora bruguierae TaxID=1581705 RepID=UPI001BD05A7B|nr:ABC transporter ATP-binding protein [Micromonospora sp. NBRC 107566]
MSTSLLEVSGLGVTYQTPTGPLAALDDVRFSIGAGESIGIVGESGSGKSTLALALLGLLPTNATTTGAVRLDGVNLLSLNRKELDRRRGKDLALVYQDALVSLNPVRTVGSQIAEVVRRHIPGTDRRAADETAIEALRRVGIPDPGRRARQYAHEFSGGMRQRAAIAMALAAGPRVLVADEVTTALDVTVKAQILDLLDDLRSTEGMSVISISHDLEAVRRITDHLAVMYAGRVVELGPTADVLSASTHPYTAALMDCAPTITRPVISFISGAPPKTAAATPACAFAARCIVSAGREACTLERPVLRPTKAHVTAACHFPLDGAAEPRHHDPIPVH